MRIQYVIKYVADMDVAVAFHRDVLRLPLKYATPHWSEFDAGGVTLALHIADTVKTPGYTQIGYNADDLQALYAEREALGLTFTQPPVEQHGALLGRFLDSEGAECSISQ